MSPTTDISTAARALLDALDAHEDAAGPDAFAVYSLAAADAVFDAKSALRDALAADLRAAQEEVERLRLELAEALATIANERGGGDPPAPGFVFTGNAGERSAWCSVDGPVGAYVTREIGNMGRVRWQWAVIEDRYGSDESPRFRDLARGYEPTARAAIRAATKAWRGES
jgi:hypothetical protein